MALVVWQTHFKRVECAWNTISEKYQTTLFCSSVLCTPLAEGVLSHYRCARVLVCYAHHIFYSEL